MHEVNWQSVIPRFPQFDQAIDTYSTLAPLPAGSLQPRLTNSIERLLHDSHFPRMLVVTAPDIFDYFTLIKQMVSGAAESDTPIVVADHFDEKQLFGAVYHDSRDVTSSRIVHGLIHQANNGLLIVSLRSLISHFGVWSRLKSVLSKGKVSWTAAKNDNYCELPEPEDVSVRVIIVGDRADVAELESSEPELFSGLSAYTEYEQDIQLDSDNVTEYLQTIKGFQQHFGLKELEPEAIRRVMQAGARFTEEQERMPLCPLWYQSLLTEADFQSPSESISKNSVDKAIQQKSYRESYLPLRAVDDIHKGQVFIDTQGEHIGQINGLTVIEMPGHPVAYGEPARISCVVHFGDGDVSDVERKADLAGNIHAKGMMIMQAFVSAALDLDEALPFSASIVFEQSYCEVDGDSASLAELCALVSALSLQPINQSIAVTGAVDQFGRIQAVGGINEKIEGFYQVCLNKGLTGEQGVILPRTNLSALCLNQDIANAMKEGKFHIWAVEHVNETFPIICGLPFERTNNENITEENITDDSSETLLERIAARIDAFHNGEQRHMSLIARMRQWLKFH
ncbi:ATP-dependent protease [Veronia nyctiphanis]|uniref:endopeptidase La n=1 Tax=Veronia nyctiphanis TaxID=1278244 RepID=A0A4Q0YU65_9GAMM|nr:Lon protease family protein [Veronia nyctiphanis]RXJ74305.1 ATP-dependent protease [Veronia nyctiphanis]